MTAPCLLWFRNDLRVQDNPALAAALSSGRPLIAVYIHAPGEEGAWAPGAASDWWRHHALRSLAGALQRAGLPLILRRGPSLQTLRELAAECGATAVYWNRRYEPAVIERDRVIRRTLQDQGLEARSFNAALLFEPQQIANRSGQPFRVFTPFWKHLRGLTVDAPVSVGLDQAVPPTTTPEGLDLNALGLLPGRDWAAGFGTQWQAGLDGAADALSGFVESSLSRYQDLRDRPGVAGTSRLSPYLHFGQLGPRQVWHAVLAAGAGDDPGGYTFLSELAWREFAHHLLYHFPHTPRRALNEAYRDFPWQPDARHLRAWQRGMTGYPMVDAGMRELWASGWMHNRVRMLTASFLVKHLLQPWQDGARWFWDTLVDADLASNTMGWQWTAGCGADAAPYFRIFNPVLQGQKFDPEGVYVRRWIPELARLPDRYIHQPWEAPAGVLQGAGIALGRDYPEPIIGHRQGRARALAALAQNQARQRQAGEQ